MIKHNIIILENNTLYQILFELKDNFLFDIKNFNLQDLIKADLTNFVILSELVHKNFLFKEKKINHKKIIFLLSKTESIDSINDTQFIFYPFNIRNLVEKINIDFIKQKYSDHSSIKILSYSLDLNSRILFSKNNELKLTEKEVDIILFLKKQNKPQKVNVLQNQVWGYSSDLETHTVETHIYRLRKKMVQKFKDKNFIISNDEGYLIK